MGVDIAIVEVEELAVGQRRAHELLGFGAQSRWLTEAGCPVPYTDIRKPGDTKPVLRWMVKDLRAFLESRRVLPGQTNPQSI